MTPLQISTSRVQDLLQHADQALTSDSPFALRCTSLWLLSGVFVTQAASEVGQLPDDPAECIRLASKEVESWDFDQLHPKAVDFAYDLTDLARSMRLAAAQA